MRSDSQKRPQAALPIRPIDGADLAAVLALNNAHKVETSALDAAGLSRALQTAFFAGQCGRAEAMMIAYDQAAPYDNANFRWFAERYSAFVYVDRVITAEHARRRGHAAALYAELFRRARAAGHTRVTCEINLDPPNPASERFHATLGFASVGSARLSAAKTVRYFARDL